MNDERITLRLSKKERSLLEKTAKSSAMTVSSYMKKKIFDDNPDCGEPRKIYYCPTNDKLNYIQTALERQNQELLLLLLKKAYGEEYKSLYSKSYELTEAALDKFYNYKRIDNVDE